MIKLQKIRTIEKDVCDCRPICKNRRREWKDKIQKTSAELLIERKPFQECLKRWPTKVNANGPCPLFGKKRRMSNKPQHLPSVVRICQTPLDDTVDTPYLKLAELAVRLGAWDAVRARCAFCECRGCCACGPRDYCPSDETRDKIRRDMSDFDARVKDNYTTMRIMYDI